MFESDGHFPQLHSLLVEPQSDTLAEVDLYSIYRGMQHVYTLTHMFLDLVQRSEVLPASVNASELFTDAASAADNPNQLLGTLSEHKEELMLQYIGVLTVAVCGVLASSMHTNACHLIYFRTFSFLFAVTPSTYGQKLLFFLFLKLTIKGLHQTKSWPRNSV